MECNRGDIYGALTTHQALLYLTFLLVLPHLFLVINNCNPYSTFLNGNSAWEMGKSGIENTGRWRQGFCQKYRQSLLGKPCSVVKCGLYVCSGSVLNSWALWVSKFRMGAQG